MQCSEWILSTDRIKNVAQKEAIKKKNENIQKTR